MQQAGKTKVLLAEDDLSLGYVIKDNLIDAGYEVVLCPDGQAAIDKFDKNEFGGHVTRTILTLASDESTR